MIQIRRSVFYAWCIVTVLTFAVSAINHFTPAPPTYQIVNNQPYTSCILFDTSTTPEWAVDLVSTPTVVFETTSVGFNGAYLVDYTGWSYGQITILQNMQFDLIHNVELAQGSDLDTYIVTVTGNPAYIQLTNIEDLPEPALVIDKINPAPFTTTPSYQSAPATQESDQGV